MYLKLQNKYQCNIPVIMSDYKNFSMSLFQFLCVCNSFFLQLIIENQTDRFIYIETKH